MRVVGLERGKGPREWGEQVSEIKGLTAAKKIEAAIEKLTELQGTTSRAEWSAWRMYRPTRGTVFGIEDGDVNDIALTRTPQDAELVEILHRTIDAQIAILSLGITFSAITSNKFTDAALVLASAINGVTE